MPQALVGGGGGWGQGGILAGIPCAGRLAGAGGNRGWHLLVEHPSPAGYDDPGLLAPWAARHLPRGMVIRFDPRKRLSTLEQRGLDFLDAESVFAGPTIEVPERRRDYGEVRTICFGVLRGRAVIVVYTERNGIRHIISMRKANEREQRRFLPHLC